MLTERDRYRRGNSGRGWCGLLTLGLALPLASALPLPLASQEGSWESVLAEFSARIDAEVAQDGVGGITAGVFVGTELIWARGFGFADRERHLPATVGTIYRIGSISKSFTAIAMMQVAEEGKLELDGPVVDVLPALAGLQDRPEGAAPVTFRHLASHTSGLNREPGLEGYDHGPLGAWEDKILACIPTTAFFGRPGDQYRYSNIGFGILGLAVSRAAGVPFMQLVEERVIEPLGMRRTTFALTPETWPHMAKGYTVRRDGSVNTEVPYREHAGRGYKVPNGGVYSTVGDLALFAGGVSGHATRAILSPVSRATVRTVQTPEDPERGYSLGFQIYPQADGTVFMGHGGSVPGYNAHLIFEPESGVGVVMLRNYGGGATNLGRASRELLTALMRTHR